ncbi:hypothetical protein AAFF_G00071070 [Aldrovandia affinis]|uniref:TNFR-Cys domain-containing protein n=1 Tax=Aldrovandia affinis TaxID=143900 RepID=A0AAD7RYW7_9TELE|nr:hypothetical protein AAFF_G00071070 [Aldrovandia affinis]
MTTRPLCRDGEFPHEERCCVGCPKGQYVLSSCEKLKQTVCQECPHGHYTDDVNFLFKCRPCRSCHSSSHMMLAGECKANQNRQCICEDGFYCVESSCEHCRPVSKDMECPQGHGVTTSSKGQMACTKCPEGTYNNVTDSKTPCLPHTNCKAPGMQLKDPGTEYSDALCEPVKIRAEPGCHWVLPACLWAGLALTVLFIGFGYFCWGTKRRSKKKKVHKLELERNDKTLRQSFPFSSDAVILSS